MFLSELRQRFSGASFTLDDVIEIGGDIDDTLPQTITDWLTTTRLPGFVAEKAQGYRLADTDDGSARYQLSVAVRNDEQVPGLLRLVYRAGSGETQVWDSSDPLRIPPQSTIQFNTVLSQPCTGVWAEPYLSLNRESFAIPIDPVDETKIVRQEPREGIEELDWRVPTDAVTVDDLDSGFVCVDDEQRSGMRLGSRAIDVELDQGLPAHNFGNPPAVWSRNDSSSAWGKYRHTFACIKPGTGTKYASFITELPRNGSWELEIHLPSKNSFFRLRDWGTWTLEVSDGTDTSSVQFDAAAAAEGWNLVGSFELAEGEVTVKLLDTTSGKIVIADAIRWNPSANGENLEDQ